MAALPFRRCVVSRQAVQSCGVQDASRECEVRKHPHKDDAGPESSVVVLLLLRLTRHLLLFHWLDREGVHLELVLLIEIFVIRGNVHVGFAIDRGDCTILDGRGDVGALGTPRDIVCVTKGVDVEDVNVGGREEEVLDELENLMLDH